MSVRRQLAWIALLAVVVLSLLALRSGRGGSSAQASGSGRPHHLHLFSATRRETASGQERALMALQTSRVPGNPHWLASWGAAPQPPSPASHLAFQGFANQTIREIVLLSSDGAAVRIHLSNAYGNRPLVIGRASAAIAGSDGDLAGAAHELSFNGAEYVTLAPGQSVVSDPVVMRVHALQRLAVSLYLPEETGRVTYHGAAEQLTFLGRGDEVLNGTGGWATNTTTSWYALTGVDTLSPPRYAGTIAAIGDSITAGYHSTINTFGAWPDDLARRLARVPGRTLAVVDEGISGNRLLNRSSCCGPSGLTRFSADVLDPAGVRDVILLEGTNDIGFSQDHTELTEPHTDVSAAAIIAGDEQMIAAAHTAGLGIYGATLLPFKGAGYWTPTGELKREAVNHWILTSGAFDGVIDFAAVMAQPGHPQVLNPAYDSGDHLHPDNAGYAVMADAVTLSDFTGPDASAASAAARHTQLKATEKRAPRARHAAVKLRT